MRGMPHTPLLRHLRRLLARVWEADPRLHTPPLPMSRRSVLLASAAAVACGPGDPPDPVDPPADTPPTELPPTEESTLPEPDPRVGIVGAGLAGLHCAWRLLGSGVPATVFEAGARVGGRLHTGRGLFPDGQLCELGGELVDSDHATMWALADELDIAMVDLEAATVGLRALVLVDGVQVDDATLIAQLTAVAPRLADAARTAAKSEEGYAAIDATSLADFLEDVAPEAAFRELHRLLEVTYIGEYGLELAEQSALNLLYLVDFVHPELLAVIGTSDERWRAEEGSDIFTTRLADGLPGQIRLGHRLIAARDGDAGGVTLNFDVDGDSIEWTFDRVVLAIPFAVLRGLDLTGLTLSDGKRDAIAALAQGTNAKVMAGFSRPVWRDAGGSGALSADTALQTTWDSTVAQDGAGGILTDFLGGDVGAAIGTSTADGWWRGVLPELEPHWPGIGAAYSGVAVLADWPGDPLALGSYSCFGPGQYVAISEHVGTDEGAVFFAGEHCSVAWQGWMEGAAISGGDVAARILAELQIPLTARHTRLPRPGRWRAAFAR